MSCRGSSRVEYQVRLDALVRRQVISWKLSDSLLVEVHLRLQNDLARSPKTSLTHDSTVFGGQGMVYDARLIDPFNRLLIHAFRFQVFYHSDEQTLLVTRGAHVTAQGM